MGTACRHGRHLGRGAGAKLREGSRASPCPGVTALSLTRFASVKWDSHASPAGWPGAFDETETDVSPPAEAVTTRSWCPRVRRGSEPREDGPFPEKSHGGGTGTRLLSLRLAGPPSEAVQRDAGRNRFRWPV